MQPPVVDEAMSDMDYLRSRICAVLEDDLEDEDDDSDEDGDNVTDHDSHSEGDNEGLLAEGSSGTGRSKDDHAGSPEYDSPPPPWVSLESFMRMFFKLPSGAEGNSIEVMP